jgi:hypothetical protein
VIEGNKGGTGGRGRRRKQLLDYFKKNKKSWNLKEETFYGTVQRSRFGKQDTLRSDISPTSSSHETQTDLKFRFHFYLSTSF